LTDTTAPNAHSTLGKDFTKVLKSTEMEPATVQSDTSRKLVTGCTSKSCNISSCGLQKSLQILTFTRFSLDNRMFNSTLDPFPLGKCDNKSAKPTLRSSTHVVGTGRGPCYGPVGLSHYLCSREPRDLKPFLARRPLIFGLNNQQNITKHYKGNHVACVYMCDGIKTGDPADY
jgi:hypothetical protein